MEPHEKILLTVIGESAVEADLTKMILEAGAGGYTVSDVRGTGHRGKRAGEFDQEGNIKIEVLCSASLAERLKEEIRKKFFQNYAIILFTSHVSVLRSEKFI